MPADDKTTRLARLNGIATLLKSKRLLTATQIAEKFDISIRTVYRDIRTLESSGIPVITVDGKGYSLMEGYTLPPLMFTEAEVNALITAEHIISKTKDASLVRHFGDALVKIKSVFRYGMKEKTDVLSSRIMVFNRDSGQTSNSLTQLQAAITACTLTQISYQKPTDEAPATRTIEPQALCYGNGNWILIAWCRLRNDYRAFRIDRMHKIDYQPATFKPRDFDLKEYLRFVH